MRTVPLALALLLLLSGCATYSWYNPNVPPEITRRDSEACRDQARQLATLQMMDDDSWGGWQRHHRLGPWGPMTSGLAVEQDLYDRCMRFKGYALIKEPKPPSSSGSQ